MGEERLKKGYNIYLYYWTIPVFIGLTLLNYYSRNFKLESLDLNLMISVVSFLFGFLITITFSMLLTRVSTLKESLALETGRLVSLYLLSKKLGKKFHENIKEKIDLYTIVTLRDYSSYDSGREIFYGMYDDLDLMEIKTKLQEESANSFLYVLGEYEPIREKLEYLTGNRTEWSLKYSNYLLGIILIALLFLNRGDTFTNILFIVLSTTIIFIFLIIGDYDNLKIGDYTYNISNSEQLFDLIGKDRYYPKSVLGRAELDAGRNYRIGIVDKKTKIEKIVDLKYSPSFFSKLNFLSRRR